MRKTLTMNDAKKVAERFSDISFTVQCLLDYLGALARQTEEKESEEDENPDVTIKLSNLWNILDVFSFLKNNKEFLESAISSSMRESGEQLRTWRYWALAASKAENLSDAQFYAQQVVNHIGNELAGRDKAEENARRE